MRVCLCVRVCSTAALAAHMATLKTQIKVLTGRDVCVCLCVMCVCVYKSMCVACAGIPGRSELRPAGTGH